MGRKDSLREDRVEEARDQAKGRRRGRHGLWGKREDNRGFRQALDPQVQSDKVIAAIIPKEGTWCVRSHWRPETARDEFKREMEGKPRPRR